MAITATIMQIINDPDATVIEVLYTDGASFKTQKEYRLSSFDLNGFKQTVKSQIDQFSQTTNIDKVLTVGPFDTAITTPAPTPKQTFLADLQLQRQMEKAIALGLKDAGDQDYNDLKGKIKTEFLPEYVSVL